jgi:pimeloyl-ACP methyl ester carboxylesterase
MRNVRLGYASVEHADLVLIAYLLFFLMLLYSGGISLGLAKTPMATYLYSQPAAKNHQLFVLLPGITDRPRDYVRRGFIDAVRKRGLPIDLIAADARYGYYARRNLVERLKADVIVPAQAMGYSRIWLVGVSLGGFGSLLYSQEHPDDVAGMLILAPFLGKPDLIDEISQAGGLRRWRPAAGTEEKVDYKLWAWLRRYDDPDNGLPPLYLGYGSNDRFATADALLADILPPNHVYVMAGGHEWSTWRRLWEKALDGPFCVKG